MADQVNCLKGVPIKGNRILVPKQLRAEVLEALHSVYQGVNGMMANARQIIIGQVWTPASDRQEHSARYATTSPIPAQGTTDATFKPGIPIPKDGHRPIWYAWKELHGIRRSVHWLDWSSPATIGKGCSNMWCVEGLVLYIRCTWSDVIRWWATIWLTGVQLVPGWLGCRERTSSAYYLQSNGQAELTVKTAKRILMDCINGYGCLRHDRAARAMMTHRNTPHQDVGLSPAKILYGRTIKDHLPILRENHQIHKHWRETKELRERGMVKRHVLNQKQYNTHSRPL